jgi:two-component system chemotaxis response regulator CheB
VKAGRSHQPSLDALFASLANPAAADVLAVVLTGMGQDGLEGSRLLRAAGATVLAEAESSCVVYGMPRSVVEANLASDVVPLGAMAGAILQQLEKS